MKRGLDCLFSGTVKESILCWILCVKFTLLLPKFLQMKVTLKKRINSTYYPLFGTSLLNIYLFILESKGLVIFIFNFSEFQQLGNKYAKYILYCAFVIVAQWFSIFKIFNKYQKIIIPNVFPYGSFTFSPKCPMFIYYVPNLFLGFPIAHFIPNVLPKIFLL